MDTIVRNQVFADQTMNLDGMVFRDCKFTRCELGLSEWSSDQFTNCEFLDCTVTGDGWLTMIAWTVERDAERHLVHYHYDL